MNATTTYLNAIDDHINSRIEISKAQAEFVVAYNTMTKLEQGAARDAIAQRVSQRTGVKTIVITKFANKGRLGFKAKHAGGTDRSEAARQMLIYYTPKVVVEKASTKKATTRKSADPVAQTIKMYESLTAAQKRAFMKSV